MSGPTTESKLLDNQAVEEIEARAAKATPGPWRPYHRISPRGAYKQWHIGNKDGLCQITMNGKEHDYEFMAHAREDVPALCATVKHLRAENERAIRVLVNAHNETVDTLQSRLAQVEKERDAAGTHVARLHDELVDMQEVRSTISTAMRDKCVEKVREYLTDCRDEETGIIEAIALELQSLPLDEMEQENSNEREPER